MTPAEFRCLREYLGLTTQWIAVQLGVGPRAVLRWESPGGTVPRGAAALLRDEYAVALAEVDQAQPAELGTLLKVPSEASWHGNTTYPPSWYRHIAARVAAKLGGNMLAVEYEK